MAEYRDSVDIEAPPDVVFDLLVTPEGLTAWMGESATLEARPGGAFAVDIAGHPIRGAYLEVDRPSRVRVSWGMPGSDDLPPGASTVTFALSPIPGGTRVDLTHSDLPDAQVPGHEYGWRHFLPRLLTAAREGDAGPDGWRPLGE